MGVSRDCGHFRIALNISGGIHDAPGVIAKVDPKFRDKAAKALIKIKEQHEKEILAMWCKMVGWDEEKAEKAATAAQKDREALLEADRKGREERRKRRLEAGLKP